MGPQASFFILFFDRVQIQILMVFSHVGKRGNVYEGEPRRNKKCSGQELILLSPTTSGPDWVWSSFSGLLRGLAWILQFRNCSDRRSWALREFTGLLLLLLQWKIRRNQHFLCRCLSCSNCKHANHNFIYRFETMLIVLYSVWRQNKRGLNQVLWTRRKMYAGCCGCVS